MSKSGVPYIALGAGDPSIPIAWLYAFNEDFFNWTLAATMVIAITFAGSAIAAAILPWRKPDIYNASPIAKYRIAGLPLITVTASASWRCWRSASTSGCSTTSTRSTTRAR